MSYQPLATKYRPQTFEDLVGQQTVAQALSSSIDLGRIHPATIFSGIRGIGKTTTARLLAKALNCDTGPTSKPCGDCDSCKAITVGVHEDVMEIDGASNNGVDEVRALKETTSYIPQRSKYKVYIIDEVHMLSKGAFNALLKTLEEPPPHVVFIFATTELQKVPKTIISRCQTFYLNKMSPDDVKQRIKQILTKEQITFDEDSLNILAREGHGSMRDAITFLDQAIALGGGKIERETIAGMSTHLSGETYLELIEALVARDGVKTIELIESLDQQGVIFKNVVSELAQFSRHCFVASSVPKEKLVASHLDLSQGEIDKAFEVASKADPFDLNRIFRTLVKCKNDLDGSALDRYICENYLLEWCQDPGLPNLETLANLGTHAQQTAPQAPHTHTSVPQASIPEAGKKPGKSILAAFKAAGEDPEKKNFNLDTPPTPKPKTEPEKSQEIAIPQFPKKQEKPKQAAPTNEVEISFNDIPSRKPQAATDSTFGTTQTTATNRFPTTWPEMVKLWQKEKPLQAKKIEQAHPLVYTEELIKLAVDPGSLAGAAFNSPQAIKHVEDDFKELVGFTGRLEVISDKLAMRASPAAESAPSPEASAPLPESIVQTREREKRARREEILRQSESDELVKTLVESFGGKIVDIEITNRELLD